MPVHFDDLSLIVDFLGASPGDTGLGTTMYR